MALSADIDRKSLLAASDPAEQFDHVAGGFGGLKQHGVRSE